MKPKPYNPLEKAESAGGLPAPPHDESKTCVQYPTTDSSNQAPSDPSQHDPGPFPLDALSPAARAMAIEVARVYGVPPEMPGMAALATIAASCGQTFNLTGAVTGQENHANLYVAIAAPRGTGKSCVRVIVRPLIDASEKVEREYREATLPGLKAEKAIATRQMDSLLKAATETKKKPQTVEGLETQQELAGLLARLDEIEPKLAASRALWAENVTSEALAALLAVSEGTLMIYSAEGGEALRVFAGRYRADDKGDFDLLLKGYTGEPVRVHRRGRSPLLIAKPCLSVLLMVQPSILDELFVNQEAVDRGLLTRALCITCPAPPREDDGTVDNVCGNVESEWRHLVENILQQRRLKTGEGREVHCTPEATEVLREFHNESVRLRRGDFADIQGELTRWRENACRVALSICIADNPDAVELTGEQAKRAVQITRWAALSMLQLLNAGRIAARAARKEKLIQLLDGNGGEMTLRELRKTRGFEESEALDLCQRFPRQFVQEVKQTKGRPSPVIRLATKPPGQFPG